MDGYVPIDETHEGAVLRELTGLGISLARNLEQRALAAKSDADAARLANAFHKVARGVRQTLALQLKLARDAVALQRERQAFTREFKPQMDRAKKEEVSRRHTQLYGEMERIVWDEFEDQEAFDEIMEMVGEHLAEAAELDTFLEEPFALQLATLKARFIGPEEEATEPAVEATHAIPDPSTHDSS